MKVDFEAIAIVTGVGALGAFTSLIGEFSFTGLVTGFCTGCFLGFAGLSFFDEKRWKPRPLVCGLLAGAATTALAIGRDGNPYPILFYTISGFIFGYFAPYFAKYL